ncbi:MAG: tyrosine-type recombinase/integrase [Beijerinckiaceae bacterium]
MARTLKDAKIDTRTARLKLPERREPYWRAISSGCALGYRRGIKGGTWVARFRKDDGKQTYESLGAADDVRDADGLTVFTFAQAQERARQFFDRAAREDAGHLEAHSGPYTVAQALVDYFRARDRRGSRGVAADRSVANSRILPALGDMPIAKLTTRRIREWHTDLGATAKYVRTKQTVAARATKPLDRSDEDAVRARRASANRILTVLKAALNHAFHEGRAQSDEPWRKVKPFRGADTPVVRFLSPAESLRLVNACQGSFRDIVRGALLTGCRYGELTRMVASDFHRESGTVTVRRSKAGKARRVVLNDEGVNLFNGLTVGRGPGERIFRRDDGGAWKASQQQRPLEVASEAAKVSPAATFHILRHTYASNLAMKGVPMGVIAAQLGHSDTRMTEKHYAHLAPSYVAETIRAAMPARASNTDVFKVA